MVRPGALQVPGLGPLLSVSVVGEDVSMGSVSILATYNFSVSSQFTRHNLKPVMMTVS